MTTLFQGPMACRRPLFGPLLGLALAGCAAGAPPSATPTSGDTATPPEEAPSSFAAPATLSDAEQELARAEAQVLALVTKSPGAAADTESAAPPATDAPGAPNEPGGTVGGSLDPQRAPTTTRVAEPVCITVCKALESMRRSAERICTLTGDAEDRCARARTRVSTAERHIEESACRCG